MIQPLSRLLLTLTLLFVSAYSAHAADPRMEFEVKANQGKGISVQDLHRDVRAAAEMALPQLWFRIVPNDARKKIPAKMKAVSFLERATPTPEGVTITFNARRVFAWLKANNVPYVEQLPALNLDVQLLDAKGRSMDQSARVLKAYAQQTSSFWGYALDENAASLVLSWQYQNNRQVLLSVRGTSRLGEFSDMRQLASGDPVTQLKPWLSEILLKARDSSIPSVENETQVARQDSASPSQPASVSPVSQGIYLLLSIQRHASLPEQVLFEEDLRRERRILDLSLRQVNRDGQQYRLRLNGADDQWLTLWFKHRGLTLSPTIEGWVAR